MSRRIAAIVLAAGRSERMGAANKLTLELGGTALVLRSVDAALGADVAPVLVVTGSDAESVRDALGSRHADFVHNADHAEGMGTSIAAGARALPGDIDAALLCLGDMPRVAAPHVAALCAAFDDAPADAICVPVHGGRRGHPVLFAAAYRPALERLTGDHGARGILEAHPGSVIEVEVPDDGVLADIDTPADFDRERVS